MLDYIICTHDKNVFFKVPTKITWIIPKYAVKSFRQGFILFYFKEESIFVTFRSDGRLTIAWMCGFYLIQRACLTAKDLYQLLLFFSAVTVKC